MTRLTRLALVWLLLAAALLAASSCDGGGSGVTPSPTVTIGPPTSQGFLAVANFSNAGPGTVPEADARLTVYDVATAHSTDLGTVNSSCFSWSPDGRHLAFGGSRGLALATFPGGAVTPIDGLPAAATFNCPGGWAPSGGRFTFATSTGDGNSLWVTDVAAGNAHELVAATATGPIGSSGLWLDDDHVLATTQGVDDRGRILIVNSWTGAVEKTYDPGGLVSGVSVRGDGVVAVGVSSGTRSASGNRVVILDPRMQELAKLIDGATGPAWSPAGSHLLAFHASYGEGPNQLLLFRADGSSPQQLLAEGTATGVGSWSVDGSRLIVASLDADGHSMTVDTYRWDSKNDQGERIGRVALPTSYPAALGLVNPEYFGHVASPSGDHLAVMSPTGASRGRFNETKLLIADLASGELRALGEVGVFAGVAWSPR